jgi:outer membrane protein
MKKILWLMCLVSTIIFAQDNNGSPKVWTLKECIDYALANNLQVKRSELNAENFEITNNQYRMNLLPTAQATGSYGYNWGRGLDPVSNQYISSQRNTVSSAGLNGSWILFNGLRIQSLVKQGQRDLSASHQDLMKARNDISLAVVNYFVTVVFNKEQVENARLQLASSQQQLDRTKKQVEAGAVPRSEQLNLEAQVATNELNLVNQNNALSVSTLQLKQAMQMPASQSFDVAIPQIDPEDLVLDQSRNEIYDMARATLPEIKSTQLKVESSYLAIRAARGNLYPRLSLTGSLNSNYSKSSEAKFVEDGGYVVSPKANAVADPTGSNMPVYPVRSTGYFVNSYKFNNQFKDNLYKTVGLQITIPIFNNSLSRAAVQRSLITSAQAKVNALEVDNTLRQNIETAYNDALAASKSYDASLKQVNARDEAFRMIKQRFEIGAANYVDYQIAENNLFQARTDLSRSKYNFIFKKKLLDFYQGKPLGF